MDPDLATLIREHALPSDVAAALDGLWSRQRSTLTVPGSTGFDRYEDLGPIGEGGMGEVRRVRDRELDRVLAMKIVHAALLGRPNTMARFLEEARATAQLQHPNIVPVHDLGRTPDGRVWFTMKEVRGQTLHEVIREVHTVSVDRWEVTASGWGLRRLITAFHGVCQAVAYAHERGVVHRDLKPANTMVGRYGEVYVLDWGIAKITGRAEPVDAPTGEDPVRSGRSSEFATREGLIAGTPAYMPPEQARGAHDRIDARSDVYALGAMLREILTGRAPFQGSRQRIMAQIHAGPPPAIPRDRLPLPDELVEACARASAWDPDDRFPTADRLAEAVQGWLDGSRRREQALNLVERAVALEVEASTLEARAVAFAVQSAALLDGVEPWEPEAHKTRGWAKASQAEEVALAARLKDQEVEQTLTAAFAFEPNLPEAHAKLTERHRQRHARAEADRDARGAAEARARIEAHAAALPVTHPDRLRASAYLRGDGTMTLVTDPPGAQVALFRFVERNRRSIEVFERSLGATPLREVSLPMGSYVAVITHPDREDVRYPIRVDRLGRWDGVAPGERTARPVWLPPRGFLAANEVYVPGGWFLHGGNPDEPGNPRGRAWCDAFVMDRFPVTNADYIGFLDDLVASGREADALRWAPRERGTGEGELGASIYAFADGRFTLRADADGDSWLPDAPVTLVDWFGASAYLAWRAQRTGRPVRLPVELEWEKAARGVDGRIFPWGDHIDPSWVRIVDSARGREQGDFGPVRVDAYPVDCSPAGVRGLGGNTQDWCLGLFDPPSGLVGDRVVVPEGMEASRAMRVLRGGAWDVGVRSARATARFRLGPTGRDPSLGFRGLFRPVEALVV